MSVGLLALLDDVAALAKVAAASLDDIAGQATKAGLKAAGAVVDDAAVTPRYVDGFAAERELPIVGKIAWGSVRNKLVFLLPAALILSLVAPWVITPILMLGGAYLCYEGAEKVFHALMPHKAEGHESGLEPAAIDPQSAEDARVAGAIKTDFILSAEIMTISLAAITVDNFWTRAAILALVGVGITALVYGTVAVLVKADDFGVLLARKGRLDLTRKLGRWLVRTMPVLMRVLTIVGTAAMIWVGGGIILHGLASFGLVAPEHWIDAAAEYASHALPFMSGFAGWAATAFIDGLFGLAFGLLMVPVAGFVIAPIWRTVKSLLPKRA